MNLESPNGGSCNSPYDACLVSGPKFVEASGVQPVCRYCSRKFRSAQGLTTHIHMHERAGDLPVPFRKQQGPHLHARASPAVDEDVKSVFHPVAIRVESPIEQVVKRKIPVSSPPHVLMTRRFTVAEKLRILHHYQEEEISQPPTAG